MIIDFKVNEAEFNQYPTLCIIGSGAVGLATAMQFQNDSNLDVLLIESGDLAPGQEPAKSKVKNSGDVDSVVDGSFNYGFGGSTNSWGGQALPFSRLDFGPRAWVDHSSWPISHECVTSYHQQVERFLGIDYMDFQTSIWPNGSTEVEKLLSKHGLGRSFSKWCPQPKFAKLFETNIEQSQHISMLVNARVTDLKFNSDVSQVQSLTVRNSNGETERIIPRITIVAAGGFETPRLLLHSLCKAQFDVDSRLPALGSFYQDHIGIYGARLIPRDWRLFRDFFATKMVNQNKCVPKVFLTEEFQSTHKRLNVTGNIGVENADDSGTNNLREIYHAARGTASEKVSWKHFLSAMKHLPSSISAVYTYLVKRQIYMPRAADYFLIVNCESPPLKNSSISLTSQLDESDVPIVNVNWALHDDSLFSIRDYCEAIKLVLEQRNIASVEVSTSLYEEGQAWKDKSYSLYHHMGSTRMSTSSRNGVVDANCKVHGINNLYIAGCSVFPTSSSSNPTFTAIALAFRLVEHLKRQI